MRRLYASSTECAQNCSALCLHPDVQWQLTHQLHQALITCARRWLFHLATYPHRQMSIAQSAKEDR